MNMYASKFVEISKWNKNITANTPAISIYHSIRSQEVPKQSNQEKHAWMFGS